MLNPMDHQEQARKLQQMYEQAYAIKDKSPEHALQLFVQMKAMFPQANGIEAWIEYLEKRITLLHHKTQAPSPQAHTQSVSSQAQAPVPQAQTQNSSSRAQASSPQAQASSPQPHTQSVSPQAQGPAPQTHTQASSPHTQASSPHTQAPATQAQNPTTQPLDQEAIKSAVRLATQAAKKGDQQEALKQFDHAIQMLFEGQGPAKTKLTLLKKRLSLQVDPELCLNAAELAKASGEIEQAVRFLDMGTRKDPKHLPCLLLDVEIAKIQQSSHRQLSALMKLCDAYEALGDFPAFDQLQREIGKLREQM
ncbi:MAG: hypothetical protein AAGJ35_06415 [Myxococcota bacterium]